MKQLKVFYSNKLYKTRHNIFLQANCFYFLILVKFLVKKLVQLWNRFLLPEVKEITNGAYEKQN